MSLRISSVVHKFIFAHDRVKCNTRRCKVYKIDNSEKAVPVETDVSHNCKCEGECCVKQVVSDLGEVRAKYLECSVDKGIFSRTILHEVGVTGHTVVVFQVLPPPTK